MCPIWRFFIISYNIVWLISAHFSKSKHFPFFQVHSISIQWTLNVCTDDVLDIFMGSLSNFFFLRSLKHVQSALIAFTFS